MGTHPIFESDFDCLTEGDRYVEMKRKSTTEKEPEEPSSVCVVAPIDYYGPIGRGIRHCLLAFIEVGQPLLVALQKRRTANFTRAMRTASLLGFEEFFTFFVIFLNLCINTRLARLYIILMAFAFYCIGCAKAFLCLPRPRLPLVKPLESALDWALPSNHAVMATCLPLYVWFYSYLHQAQLGLTSVHCLIICLLMCSWSVLVMFSRLYLGVHSPADIVSGGILGSILLSLFLQVDDQIDLFISQRGFESILYYLIFVVFLLSIFPSTDVSNPCCSDAVILLGCVLGAVSAQSTGHSALFDDFSILTLNFWSRAFVRMTAVTIQLGVMKPALKAILKPIWIGIYNWFGMESYSGKAHIIETKKDPLYRYAKHLQPSFRIPPVKLQGTEPESELLGKLADKRFSPASKWNHDLPINFFTYGALQFTMMEVMPPVLEWIESHIF